jgi:hypothetical protein
MSNNNYLCSLIHILYYTLKNTINTVKPDLVYKLPIDIKKSYYHHLDFDKKLKNADLALYNAI